MGRANAFAVNDWDALRFFLAVARHGSLSAASRVLKVAQPTVGRRVAAFEERLGAKLFVPTRLGQELSAAGRELLKHAERMELEALAVERLTLGRDQGMRGTVCITAAEWMIDGVLSPSIGGLSAKHPELELELLADVRHLNLVRREADVALRLSRFEEADVVQRQLGVVAFGLYASPAYLERHGLPDFAKRCEGHRLIAMSRSLTKIADLEWLEPLTSSATIVVRTNGRKPMATLASAGLGLACLPRILGDRTLGLRRLRTPSPEPERPLWLGVHHDVRRVPRVRATVTFLAEALGRLRKAFAPQASRTA